MSKAFTKGIVRADKIEPGDRILFAGMFCEVQTRTMVDGRVNLGMRPVGEVYAMLSGNIMVYVNSGWDFAIERPLPMAPEPCCHSHCCTHLHVCCKCGK